MVQRPVGMIGPVAEGVEGGVVMVKTKDRERAKKRKEKGARRMKMKPVDGERSAVRMVGRARKESGKELIITVRPTQPCRSVYALLPSSPLLPCRNPCFGPLGPFPVHGVIRPHHSSPSFIRDARRATAAGGTISTKGFDFATTREWPRILVA